MWNLFKLTTKTSEIDKEYRSVICIVKFKRFNLFLEFPLLALNVHYFPAYMHFFFFNNTPETKTQPSFHKHFLGNGYIKYSLVLSPFVSRRFGKRFCIQQYRSFYLGIVINSLLSIFAVGHVKMLWTWMKGSWVYFQKFLAEKTKNEWIATTASLKNG